jgi:predicted nucleic-acid-binding protein
MSIVLDTNVIVRHLTQQPADQGAAASRFLAKADALLVTDVIVAETVHVLHSVYQASVETIATSLRALISMRSVELERGQVIRRTLDLYETAGMDFTDAYLVAVAEAGGIDQIASFDQGIDKAVRHASAVTRRDPFKDVR